LLFAAGIALLTLLVASYAGRHTWLACASMGLSIAALFGLVFLSGANKPAQIQARSEWLSSQLAPVLGRQSLDDEIEAGVGYVKTAIGQAKTAVGYVSNGLSAASSWAGRQAMQAAATASWFGGADEEAEEATLALQPPALPTQITEPSALPQATAVLAPPSSAPPALPPPSQATAAPPPPQATAAFPPRAASASRSPVKWLLDDSSGASPGAGDGFSIAGINVSDQELRDVHGVLKLDSGQREYELSLAVEGGNAEAGASVPAGAQFTLRSALREGSEPGGAVLRFRYSVSGQEKATILHLAPPLFARLANGG
jgi:hypothetical protein